ncbi:MAG: lysophospholipid acyltransferase family protein [Planctomycetota bacterium]
MSVSATRSLVRLSDAYRRLLTVFVGIIGPRAAYACLGALARRVYRLFDPLRLLCEAQCQAALGATRTTREITDIAKQSFVHRAWNLADLMLADRLIRRGTYQNYGGRIPEPYRSMLWNARRNRQPVILLTAYYGPYDLLPLFLGYNGIRAGAVYRRHANPSFDAYRQAIRARSGCEMIPDTEAVMRLPQIMAAGGSVAILADHHATRRGIPVTLLGQKTNVSRSVGLLATHYETVVVVAGIRRLNDAFNFEIVIADLFEPSAWKAADDPVRAVTERYIRGLEQIIRADPRQYLWAHALWGAEQADRLTGAAHSPDVSA